MVKDWCNKGSTWDNTLAAMKGEKKPSKKENDDLISLMLGEGIDAPTIPEPTKTRLSKEAVDECIAAVNATLVIPHPTADDQPKCVACKTAVAIHMVMPTNHVEGKNIYLTIATHACLSQKRTVWFLSTTRRYVDVRLHDTGICLAASRVILKKKQKIGPANHKGCGVDLGIGEHLLGTTKEWMILGCSICKKCLAETYEAKKCVVEGCDKYPQVGCSGHCMTHATHVCPPPPQAAGSIRILLQLDITP